MDARALDLTAVYFRNAVFLVHASQYSPEMCF